MIGVIVLESLIENSLVEVASPQVTVTVTLTITSESGITRVSLPSAIVAAPVVSSVVHAKVTSSYVVPTLGRSTTLSEETELSRLRPESSSSTFSASVLVGTLILLKASAETGDK